MNARVARAALLVGVVGVLIPVGAGYRRLCTAPLDAYPVLDAARTAAKAEVGVAAERPGGESWGERLMERGAAWRTQALDRAIQIKQSDGFAFPLHVATGLALEAGRCPVAVVGDQWRKAAFHASSDWAASVAAMGLARTSGATLGDATVVSALRAEEVRQPWYAANIQRVLERYGERDE